MAIFNKLVTRKKDNKNSDDAGVSTIPSTYFKHPFSVINSYIPLQRSDLKLYRELREAIPVIDAAIEKIVRLTGKFKITSENEAAAHDLNQFLDSINVNGTGAGISAFISAYLDDLLTFGTAVGEMVINPETLEFEALYNACLEDIELRHGDNPLNVYVCRRDSFTDSKPLPNQNLILMSVLNPEAGKIYGNSILKGLPFVSSVLLKIFNTIGTNWERVGNVRFAVTYKPSESAGGKMLAKERARLIADEWSKAMRDTSHISDFVSVGDISIKVIGADNQILDSEVPVKHMLEQIVAKLGIPPCLLGISWSSTERMSAVQVDILTSELEYYRQLLNPCIAKICNLWLRLNGLSMEYSVDWENINLQDEVELANARVTNARAAKLENELLSEHTQHG